MSASALLRALHHSQLSGSSRELVFAEYLRTRDHFAILLGEALATVALPSAQADARIVAALTTYVGVQLADDLADGDVPEPRRATAATLQFTLAQLRLVALSESGIGPGGLRAIGECLQRTADAQHFELACARPQLADNQRFALGFGAAQYEAYLRLCWSDTPREAEAPALARGLGVGLHLEHEIRSRDPRVFAMDEAARRELFAWGREIVAQTEAAGLESAARVLAQSLFVLQGMA